MCGTDSFSRVRCLDVKSPGKRALLGRESILLLDSKLITPRSSLTSGHRASPLSTLTLSDGAQGKVLHLPSPRALARHALPSLLEAVVAPMVLFYIIVLLVGFQGALVASLAWTYAAIVRRIIQGHGLPGVLLLGAAVLTGRSILALMTHSAFLYFIQPTAATAAVALAFMASTLIRRPLAERLAKDFCPFDPDLLRRPFIRRFFLRISLLWSVVLFANAGLVMWFLIQSSLKSFVLERGLASLGLEAAGIVLSVLWFTRMMRGEGVALRWGRHALSAHSPSHENMTTDTALSTGEVN